MATGVNYWSSYEPTHKVRDSVWGGAELDSSSEDGGGGDTQDTSTMEVRGQLILVPGQDSGPDRKHRAQRLVELQERRRGLQTLLGTRLDELRRICLQEAELTGLLPADFPLEAGEKAPCVRRRGGSSRQTNRKSRPELEESQRPKPLKKTLFSSVRKHSDPEHNTQLQPQSQRTKRTVHRGCHTDDAVRSESSSTSDSTGHEHDDYVSRCRPLLVTAGTSPVEVFSQNKPRNNSLHNKHRGADSQDVPHRPSPPHPPPPPPRSQDGSTSSGQTEPEPGRAGGNRGGRTGAAGGNSARRSNSSDGILDRGASTDEDGLWVNGLTSSRGALRSSETDARTVRMTNGPDPVRPEPCRGRAPYSDLLLDYVWAKQQQMLQRQQSHGNRQPITSLYSNQHSTLAPPTYRGLHGNRQRIKVTRTKSCGPFLPVQPPGAENYDSQHAPVQPDPHPQLRPPLSQDSPTEEATRSLHKALALEGLRDWYLRNTLGPSHQNQTQSNGNVSSKTNRIKGRRRTTHGVIHHHSSSHNAPLHQSNFQDVNHNGPIHKKTAMPHSATFHGLSLHGRSMDRSLYDDSFPLQDAPLRQTSCDQPSPGTLV